MNKPWAVLEWLLSYSEQNVFDRVIEDKYLTSQVKTLQDSNQELKLACDDSKKEVELLTTLYRDSTRMCVEDHLSMLKSRAENNFLEKKIQELDAFSKRTSIKEIVRRLDKEISDADSPSVAQRLASYLQQNTRKLLTRNFTDESSAFITAIVTSLQQYSAEVILETKRNHADIKLLRSKLATLTKTQQDAFQPLTKYERQLVDLVVESANEELHKQKDQHSIGSAQKTRASREHTMVRQYRPQAEGTGHAARHNSNILLKRVCTNPKVLELLIARLPKQSLPEHSAELPAIGSYRSQSVDQKGSSKKPCSVTPQRADCIMIDSHHEERLSEQKIRAYSQRQREGEYRKVAGEHLPRLRERSLGEENNKRRFFN